MQKFEGKWIRESTDNWDAYAKAIGLTKTKRDMIDKVPHKNIQIKFNILEDNQFEITNKMGPVFKTTQKIELGKACIMDLMGTKVEAIFTYR